MKFIKKNYIYLFLIVIIVVVFFFPFKKRGYKRIGSELTISEHSEERQKFSIRAYGYIVKINKKLSKEDALSIINNTWNASQERGRDPYFYLAIARVESGFILGAEGKHGEIGLWQMKVKTAKYISSGLITNKKMRRLLRKPFFSINIGSGHLEDLIDMFDGNIIKALMAYNCGASKVKGKNIPDGTYEHITKVMTSYYELKKDE